MELRNPDAGIPRPDHGGRDRHFCVGVQPDSVAALTDTLDREGARAPRSVAWTQRRQQAAWAELTLRCTTRWLSLRLVRCSVPDTSTRKTCTPQLCRHLLHSIEEWQAGHLLQRSR
jgi:hypothetical protein